MEYNEGEIEITISGVTDLGEEAIFQSNRPSNTRFLNPLLYF